MFKFAITLIICNSHFLYFYNIVNLHVIQPYGCDMVFNKMKWNEIQKVKTVGTYFYQNFILKYPPNYINPVSKFQNLSALILNIWQDFVPKFHLKVSTKSHKTSFKISKSFSFNIKHLTRFCTKILPKSIHQIAQIQFQNFKIFQLQYWTFDKILYQNFT